MGSVVREERHRRKWTQDQLAKKSGVGQSQISIIEGRGNQVTKDETLLGIAAALGLDAASLRAGKAVPRAAGQSTRSAEVERLLTGLSPSSYQQWLGYGAALLDAQPTGASYDPSNTDVVDALRDSYTWKEQCPVFIDEDSEPTTKIQRIENDSDPATPVRELRNAGRARRDTRTVKDVK